MWIEILLSSKFDCNYLTSRCANPSWRSEPKKSLIELQELQKVLENCGDLL